MFGWMEFLLLMGLVDLFFLAVGVAVWASALLFDWICDRFDAKKREGCDRELS